MLYLVKGNFQKMIRWMAGRWMTPNMASFFGVIFVILTALTFYLGMTFAHLRFCLFLVAFFFIYAHVYERPGRDAFA